MPVVRCLYRIDVPSGRNMAAAQRRNEMGNHLIGWMPGVPVIIPVIIYVVMN